MDDDDFDALFRKACDGGLGAFERAGGGCTKLGDTEHRLYRDAVTSTDVDESAFASRLDETDVSDANARRAFTRTGRYGVEMATELDDAALNRFVQLDVGSRRALVRAWRAEGADIDSTDVETILDEPDLLSLLTARRTIALDTAHPDRP